MAGESSDLSAEGHVLLAEELLSYGAWTLAQRAERLVTKWGDRARRPAG